MPRLSVDISLEQHRALKWAAMQSPGSTVTTVVRGWLDRLPVPPQGAPIEEQESRSVEPVAVTVPVEADIYDVLSDPDPPALYGADGLDGRDFLGPNVPMPQGAVSGCPHPSRRVLPYGTFCETCGTKL